MSINTLFLTNSEISARMYRGLVTDLFGEGIRNVAGNEYRVIPRASGANMTVTIQKGTGEDAVAYIKGDDVSGQGTYRVTMDTDFPDLGIAAAPASGSRTDLIVLETVDSQVVGGTTNLSRPRVLTGISAITAEKTVIPLARISVPAGTTSIQASNITDLRTAQTGGGGAVRTAAQPLSAAQITALTGMRIGDLVMNTDTGKVQVWNGSAWTNVGGGASGVFSFPVLTLTTTYQTVAFFVGLGFQEVNFAMSSTGSTTGVLATATASAVQLRGIVSLGVSGATLMRPTATTDAFQAGIANNSASQVRNIRLDSDGFLRMEVRASTGTLTTSSSDQITWGAR